MKTFPGAKLEAVRRKGEDASLVAFGPQERTLGASDLSNVPVLNLVYDADGDLVGTASLGSGPSQPGAEDDHPVVAGQHLVDLGPNVQRGRPQRRPHIAVALFVGLSPSKLAVVDRDEVIGEQLAEPAQRLDVRWHFAGGQREFWRIAGRQRE